MRSSSGFIVPEMLNLARRGWQPLCTTRTGEKFPPGVIDGARTRDSQNHNLELYQLSYDHHLGIERAPGGTGKPDRYSITNQLPRQ